MKGSIGVVGMVLVIVMLDVTTEVEPEPAPDWFPTLAVGPDMMTVCGEGGLESDEESNEAEKNWYRDSRDD